MGKIAWVLGFSVISAASLVGCGGSDSDGGSGGGALNSGVDKSKLGQDLTDAEAQQMCKAVGDYGKTVVSEADSCRAAGFAMAAVAYGLGTAKTDADIQTACKQTEKDCIDTPAQTTDTCANETAPATCTSTVGEIENCLADAIKQSADALKAIPACDSLKASTFENSSSGGGSTQQTLPASCDTVQKNCPEALNKVNGSGDVSGA